MHLLGSIFFGRVMTSTSLLVDTVVTGNDSMDYAIEYDDQGGYESDNSTRPNCTNDYCVSNEDYIMMIEDHIFPDSYDWVLIAMHTVVFIVGLIGNALVCLAVYRNHSMRTVTNYFIVNLAVADMLVILICLPPTVVWDVTETWFLGLKLCKAVLYLQTVSVTVSILTLTFISIDRWYAICFPLRFKSTTGRAKTAIIIIWLIALLFDIPDLLVMQIQPPSHLRVETIIFTQCAPSWSQTSKATFDIIKFIFLYTGPLIFMSVAYWQIIRVLWRSDIPGHNLSTRGYQMNGIPAAATGNPEGQLRSRRKAAKMLVAVVLMFAICYLPVQLFAVLRHTVELPANKVVNIMHLLAHWLCYANSAINPLIYNFMSGKFRQEFRRAFLDCNPSNDGTGGRSPTVPSSYRLAANGYRLAQNRRDL